METTTLYYDTDQGTYVERMLRLVQTGFTPFGVADVFHVRLDGTQQEKDFWKHTAVATADGAAFYRGKVKVIRDALALKTLTPQTPRSYGAVILTPEEFAALEGREFSTEEMYEVMKNITIGDNDIVRALVGDVLADDYGDVVYLSRVDIEMGHEQEVPTMRPWVVGQEREYENWSNGKRYSNARSLVLSCNKRVDTLKDIIIYGKRRLLEQLPQLQPAQQFIVSMAELFGAGGNYLKAIQERLGPEQVPEVEAQLECLVRRFCEEHGLLREDRKVMVRESQKI